MISVANAQKIIDREVRPLGAESIPLSDSVGRVLAQDIIADMDLPPFDRSMMDGYAVIAADTRTVPASLTIVGESAAGRGWRGVLNAGEAVRIMTGAPAPAGADAVQKLELARESGDIVEILESVKQGQSIVRAGSEVSMGSVLFGPGDRVTNHMIPALASFGYAKVRVGKAPRVTIFGTGSEIVDINQKPGRDQIRNSNTVMLDALCRSLSATATILPNVKDEISDLSARIKDAASHSDVVILTGGVSVGKYDHTKTALAELGATVFFEKIRLKPGKPAVFAKLGKAFIFGLPGNPVSAAVTFHLFARKALLRLQGASETDLPRGHAVLAFDAKAARDRDSYVPIRLETTKLGQLVGRPLKWQGSSDLVGFSRCEALAVLAKGSTHLKGAPVPIVFLG